MKKPNALTELLEELESENIHSDVEASAASCAVIYLCADDADNEDGISLDASECKALFASLSTVARLLEALDNPVEASLTVTELVVPYAALSALERGFTAVDDA